jgi:hypothetical protein
MTASTALDETDFAEGSPARLSAGRSVLAALRAYPFNPLTSVSSVFSSWLRSKRLSTPEVVSPAASVLRRFPCPGREAACHE